MTAMSRTSDVRVSDLLLGILLALAILLCAATLLLHAGFTREAVAAAEPEAVPVVTVQPVEGRGEASPEPKALAEPEPEVPSEPEVAQPRVLDALIERVPEDEPKRQKHRRHRARSVVAPTPVQGTPGDVESASSGAGEGSVDDGEAFVRQYRTMLRQWLASRVRLRDTGVGASELDGKRIRITLQIDHARTVTRVEIVPTGLVAFDRAMLEAALSLQGQTLPEPPAGYPGPLQSRIPAVFVCNPGACR